jgi:hypothetical protein
MPMMSEPEQVSNRLTVSREPVGPKNAASKGSVGDVALMDALAIVIAAWVILFLLSFSLRRHNI